MQISTKLPRPQVVAAARKFGLNDAQIENFTIHEFENGAVSVAAYPGNTDTKGLTRFLEHLVSTGVASTKT